MPVKPWLALILCLTGCASLPVGEPGWLPLFDGKTLTGWTPKITGSALGADALGTFRVRDGAIQVSYRNYDRFGGRFGHLAYRTPFTSYRLRFEYRFTGTWLPDVEAWQQSNSGVMLHGQSPRTMTREQLFPVSLEVQLLGADRAEVAPTANLCTPGTQVVIDGVLDSRHCVNAAGPVLPNGGWVEAEVEVRNDGTVIHSVQGRPVLRYRGAQYDPADPDAKPLIAKQNGRLSIDGGYIYLQSEGHPVEFRNIALKPLAPTRS